jgi:hypothetical protein
MEAMGLFDLVDLRIISVVPCRNERLSATYLSVCEPKPTVLNP